MESGWLQRFVRQEALTISASRRFLLSILPAIPRPVLLSPGRSAIQRSWAHDRAQQNPRTDWRCAALYRVHSCSSLVRASFSSRWHAAAVRPGRPTAAAGRQVRSTSNFGTVSAARTTCETVKMIGNSAGMICPPLAPSSKSHIPAGSCWKAPNFREEVRCSSGSQAHVLHPVLLFRKGPDLLPTKAIFDWRDAGDLSESRRKRTRSAEAKRKTDFGNGQCRTCQQCFASFDPLLNDIAMRRYSK